MLAVSVTRPSNPAVSRSFAALDHVVVALVALALFGYVAAFRMVDDDEGFYALAGRAIISGQCPYRDFFFPQTPLSALAYAALPALGARGLVPLRWFAAACAVGTTLLVQHGARREAGRFGGVLAAALFAAHTLVWEWTATVKTFPLGLLFGMAALVVATSRVVTSRGAAAAGLLAGLAIASRGLSAPVAVAVAWALWMRGESASGRVLFRNALVGLFVALLPVALVALLDPAAFWFDNVGYHAVRSPGEGLVKDVAQKLDAARAVFLAPLGAVRSDATGLQSTALLALVFAAWRASRRDDIPVRTFAVAAGLVAVVAFLPSPVYVQYFAAAVPPASVVVGIWLARRGWPRWVVVASLALYVAVAIPSFRDRLVEVPDAQRPAAVDAVGRALDTVTRVGDRVAAHWPSYLVRSQRPPLEAALNQFARLSSDRASALERQRYHLFTEDDFRDALLRREARAFVVGSFTLPETALSLKAAGWTRAAELPGVAIWVAPDGAP
jgi:hypothetical protein